MLCFLYSPTITSLHDYWKNHRWTFVGKVISLLFNVLSRLVITFLPSSKHLLISWLQSTSAVILEPRKIKSAAFSTVSPSICHEVMGYEKYKQYVLSYPTSILFLAVSLDTSFVTSVMSKVTLISILS